ncbi:MAG: hypothetical protein KH334_04545 [Clostridiales bacterium]|nr:hypothetical protein [Clostridiales bacterium]
MVMIPLPADGIDVFQLNAQLFIFALYSAQVIDNISPRLFFIFWQMLIVIGERPPIVARPKIRINISDNLFLPIPDIEFLLCCFASMCFRSAHLRFRIP